MILEDFHVHSAFSDGENDIQDIIDVAVSLGMEKIGFSDHSYTAFDESYCMSLKATEEYFQRVNSLKAEYKDKIKIYCGIEQDYYSDSPLKSFDYIIGSVHYIKAENIYIPIDESSKILLSASKDYFKGDIYSLVECYYNVVADTVRKTNADIIGHFDLITKFNEKDKIINIKNERYINAAKKAIDKLLEYKKPFEINTGAISRGYKTKAYPDDELIKYIVENGGKLILSGDSHNKESVMYEFEKYYRLYKENIVSLNIK